MNGSVVVVGVGGFVPKYTAKMHTTIMTTATKKPKQIHFFVFLSIFNYKKKIYQIHSGQKCLPRVASLWSKMPMFQRVAMREGGRPLPLTFLYLILVT